jgi:hypothetical protein
VLTPATVERVLDRLGLDARPDPDLAGLARLREQPIGDELARVLVEELGYSEEIVDRLPPDEAKAS